MQIRAEPEKSALSICNYSQILYQFFKFTQNLKQSPSLLMEISSGVFCLFIGFFNSIQMFL